MFWFRQPSEVLYSYISAYFPLLRSKLVICNSNRTTSSEFSFLFRFFYSIVQLKFPNMDSRSLTLAEEKEFENTATPSPRPSFEKETKTDTDGSPTDKEDGSVTNTPPGGEVEGEYPEGFRLAFIVIALLMSIFLVSSLILNDLLNKTNKLNRSLSI
jgi:hypothetical protein